MSYIYIASPYSSEDQSLMEARFKQAAQVTAAMLRQGLYVYSPIVHCHQIAKDHSLPTDFKFWQKYNRVMLAHAGELRVLCLPGWHKSKGVRAEIDLALELQKPVVYEYEIAIYDWINSLPRVK